MVPWERELATHLVDLSSDPGTSKAGENQFPLKLYSEVHMHAVDYMLVRVCVCVCTPTNTHTHTKQIAP